MVIYYWAKVTVWIWVDDSIYIMSELKGKKIGVFVDGLGEYHLQYLQPMREMIANLQMYMLTFVGFQLGSTAEKLKFGNDVYKLATQNNLDGLIIFATITNRLSDDAFKAFLQNKALPVVILGRELEGYSSVTSNQSTGMHQLMQYLCDQCNYQNFAFVRGWKDNFDSQVREDIFCEELSKRGLATPESLRVTGEFFAPKAEEVTYQLLDSGQPIDVIVAATDAMAQGVINALTDLNISVPEDIAVTGFDDDAISELTIPPLTTVRQPVVEIVQKTIDILVKSMFGASCMSEVLQSQLVVRESCQTTKLTEQQEVSVDVPEKIQAAFRQYLAQELDDRDLLKFWSHEVKQWKLEHGSYQLCFDWLDYFVREVEINQLDVDKRINANNFIKKARKNIVSLINYTSYDVGKKYRNNFINAMDTGRSMWAQSDMSMLMDYIQTQLPKRKINQCYVLLKRSNAGLRQSYTEQKPELDLELILRYTKDTEDTKDTESKQQQEMFFDSNSFISELFGELTYDCSLVFLPLFSATGLYGYMVIDSENFRHGSDNEEEFETMYSSFRRDMSNAIHITLQRQAIVTHMSTLENLVDKRTAELRKEIVEHKRTELELRLANGQLAEQATQDGLTGINNRYAFDKYLEKQWLEHTQQSKPISLILCDIDHFKLYNDNYGHLQGDDCLKEIAELLVSQVNYPRDFVARYGGEEFVIVLPDTSEVGACEVAEKIHIALFEKALPHETSLTIPQVTLSMGICTLIPSSETSMELIILQADQALYYVKNRGRNNFHLGILNSESSLSAAYKS